MIDSCVPDAVGAHYEDVMLLGKRRPAAVLTLVPKTAPPSPSMDDAQILAAIRRGDTSGAEALYDRVRPQVDRVIARILGRADSDCDDLAQIAIMEILASLRRFRGDCSLDTWTSRITARAVFKELRRRRIERSVFNKDAVDADSTEADTNEEQRVAARSMLERIRAHFDKLDPLKAWTLLLHDVCGYDLKEISAITDASFSAAQSRLSRGRAELQSRLERDAELATWLERKEGRS